jgi:predicted TIM-barrel fold metal-dependent hydrolase
VAVYASEDVVSEQFYTADMPEIFTDLKIIDCDTHFVEPPDLWTSRAPAKWRDRVPHIEVHDDLEQWSLDGVGLGPVSVRTVGTGRVKHRGLMGVHHFADVDPASYDAKSRVALMDDIHIWAQIVYPNASGFGGGTFGARMDADLRLFCVQAYNDAIAEWQTESGGRLLPQALVPFWDIPEAVKEARRAHDLGLSGITVSARPEFNPGTPDYGDRLWDPFWEVVSEFELPISFHTGSALLVPGAAGASDVWKSMLPPELDMTDPKTARSVKGLSRIPMSLLAGQVPTNTVAYQLPMSYIMMSGLLDRWPKLKFVLVEAGIGWVPFVLEYLDHNVREMGPEDHFGLQRMPSEYFRDHMYVMWWFEKFALRSMVEEIGENNILWESDFPHPVCLFPNPLESAAKALASQSPKIRQNIMQDNAAALWHIPVG